MGSEQVPFPGMESGQNNIGPEDKSDSSQEEKANGTRKPRLKHIDREQTFLRVVDVELLIPEDHAVRAIWELVGKLDLSRYRQKILALEGVAGRSAFSPQLLISLWIYSYSQGVRSARALENMCAKEPAYQWLTGMTAVNAHTLSDFRMAHEQELKQLFIQVLALLSADGLVTLERVMQDGTKIKALAAEDSYRREDWIREQLKIAREHVDAVDKLTEEESSERRARAKERGRRERRERLESALREFDKLKAEGKPKEKLSITDPEARKMKQSNGGFATSFNVQLVTDAANKVIVGVGITQAGNDYGQLACGVEGVEQNLGEKPKQVVADGGYVSRDNIVEMESRGVEFIGPLCDETGKGKGTYNQCGVSPEYYASQFVYDAVTDTFRCPQGNTLHHVARYQCNLHVSHKYCAASAECKACAVREQCCPGNKVTGRSVQRTEELAQVVAFREKMKTESAREIYRQRSEVAETPNLWIKEKFGLRQFRVRGLCKAGIETLWACLTYNISQWIRLRWRMRLTVAAATA
jgi:transposase